MGLIWNLVRPGSGFTSIRYPGCQGCSEYAVKPNTDCCVNSCRIIIPNTIVMPSSRRYLRMFVSLLFGFACRSAGPRGKPLVDFWMH